MSDARGTPNTVAIVIGAVNRESDAGFSQRSVARVVLDIIASLGRNILADSGCMRGRARGDPVHRGKQHA
jgi:hypothetical protein